ncbi:MAG: hypothetical protein ABSA64_04935 [Sedimentisphaerales bacterium]|jgi:hypothetical protein
MAESNYFEENCKKIAEEFKKHLDSITKLTGPEKAKILDYAKRIEHIARADGVAQTLKSTTESLVPRG